MNLWDDPTDDLGPSEWRYLVLCAGLIVLMTGLFVLATWWWPWLRG